MTLVDSIIKYPDVAYVAQASLIYNYNENVVSTSYFDVHDIHQYPSYTVWPKNSPKDTYPSRQPFTFDKFIHVIRVLICSLKRRV